MWYKGKIYKCILNQKYIFNIFRSHLDRKHSKGFPFVLNKTFKLAIGFRGSQLLIGVDGELYLKFKFRKQEEITFNGFSITTSSKLKIRISNVDHFNFGNQQWDSFDTYSNPECTCTCY